MDAFITSTVAVAIAEIGDKTQLLSLLLVARYRKPWPILWAILLATLLNHGLSAALGVSLSRFIEGDWLNIFLAFAFIAVGLWMLIPDSDDNLATDNRHHGVFLTTLVLFFIAEIGDKTQVATVLLAARFESVVAVTLGTTVGMLLANAPVLWLGNRFCRELPLRAIHVSASLLFILIGLWTLIAETRLFGG
ncbi:putative Ca2+/H+ antiporter (TMEM165/GDT1 family) [Methylohalomonas lacus]|uniref:GDT1 family protein n=1 Tax=Methylohalomonas lacus TaxID=398773 RepID=A0AAE3HLF4_9GAMM|nr:TMEM165/GDT1 family protein [Methylohalomonas lacus]MCS3903393.1 putative Ca2+/H+ antiporter (TMEM165/GDT1 family) [Methylohalomonas lacus]